MDRVLPGFQTRHEAPGHPQARGLQWDRLLPVVGGWVGQMDISESSLLYSQITLSGNG